MTDDLKERLRENARIADRAGRGSNLLHEAAARITDLEATCRRCGGEMQPGIAMGQTYTAGAPDFPADREGVTMSAGGPGVVIEARKCASCGHSVTPP